MAYEPQIWNSGNPELSLEENKENNAVLVAEKMNNIEQGIKTAHDEIANIELQNGGVATKRKEKMVYYGPTNSGSFDIDLSASNTILVDILANNVVFKFVNMNETPYTNDTIRMIYDNPYNDKGYDAYINCNRIHNSTYYIDGVKYDSNNMYRLPDDKGIIEFDIFNTGYTTAVFGTTISQGIQGEKGDKRTKGYVIPEIKLTHNVVSGTKEMYFDVFKESWSEWHGEGSLPIHIAYLKFNEVTQKHEINYITISASSFVDNRFGFFSNANEPFDTLYNSYVEGGGLNGNPAFSTQYEYVTGINMKLIYNTFVVFGGEDETKVMQPVQLIFMIDTPAG